MAGIRIHHPTLREASLLVPHPGDAATGRKGKDYVLRLDSEGNVIVSETVWTRLQEAQAAGANHGFIVLNEVADPPTINVTQGGAVTDPLLTQPTYEQVGDIAAEFAPPGMVATIRTYDPNTGEVIQEDSNG